jgi:hypothetical protein
MDLSTAPSKTSCGLSNHIPSLGRWSFSPKQSKLIGEIVPSGDVELGKVESHLFIKLS